ncbi:MAG: ankyrin repeat domain-containing protein [Gammaproteobacteria bacterium]
MKQSNDSKTVEREPDILSRLFKDPVSAAVPPIILVKNAMAIKAGGITTNKLTQELTGKFLHRYGERIIPAEDILNFVEDLGLLSIEEKSEAQAAADNKKIREISDWLNKNGIVNHWQQENDLASKMAYALFTEQIHTVDWLFTANSDYSQASSWPQVKNSLRMSQIYILHTEENKDGIQKFRLSEGRLLNYAANVNYFNVKGINLEGKEINFNLSGGDFSNANFKNADLCPTRLFDVGFKNVKFDETTKFNTPNSYGHTPLQRAVLDKNMEVIEMLLQHPQINVNGENRDGSTPLHVAAMNGYIAECEKLLERPEIAVNVHDNYYRMTPLHYAALNREIDSIEMLVRHPEIDMNIKDKYGNTPLHLALRDETTVSEETIGAIEKLLKHPNVNIDGKNRHEKTALDIIDYRIERGNLNEGDFLTTCIGLAIDAKRDKTEESWQADKAKLTEIKNLLIQYAEQQKNSQNNNQGSANRNSFFGGRVETAESESNLEEQPLAEQTNSDNTNSF